MKSSEYWTKRFSELENMQHETGLKFYSNIETSFDLAQREINSQIEKWCARFAKNNSLSMADARKLLNSDELKEFKMDVEEYIEKGAENTIDGRWMKELENASAKFHVSRLQALQIRTQQALEWAFGNEIDEIDAMMSKLYEDGYYHTCFEVQKAFNVGFDVGRIDQNKLRKALSSPWAPDGSNFSDRVWKKRNIMVNELQRQLISQILSGRTADQMINTMTKYLNDKTKSAKHNAGRLVMTEQAYISSVAQRDAFEELKVDEFEVIATLDSRTSKKCREMDGKHFEMKDFQVGVTAPPFHVFCRSAIMPYFNDEWTGGERAARGEDGKTYYVPNNFDYATWNFARKNVKIKGEVYRINAETKFKEWKKAFIDGDEFMAEAFTDVKLGSSPSEYSKRVLDVIDRNFKKSLVDGKNINGIGEAKKDVVGNKIRERRKLPIDKGVFKTFNNTKADSIRPDNIEKSLKKNKYGWKVIDYLETNNIPVHLYYGVDNPERLLGQYDSMEDIIIIYADETKTIKNTAAVIVHECQHRQLKYIKTSSLEEEVSCFIAEYKFRLGRELTKEEKNSIVEVVKDIYGY